ncbi:MAG: hypothetical protein MHMPM18_002675 [Marteilia pararefringens]
MVNRGGEIKNHNDRLKSHLLACHEYFQSLKCYFSEVKSKEYGNLEQFVAELDAKLQTYKEVTRHESIENYEKQFSEHLVEEKTKSQTRFKEYKAYIGAKSSDIAKSSQLFLKSAKHFTKGGNFSQVELENLSQRLKFSENETVEYERRYLMGIQECESTILHQMNVAVSERKDRLKEDEFELRYLKTVRDLENKLSIAFQSKMAEYSQSCDSLKYRKNLIASYEGKISKFSNLSDENIKGIIFAFSQLNSFFKPKLCDTNNLEIHSKVNSSNFMTMESNPYFLEYESKSHINKAISSIGIGNKISSTLIAKTAKIDKVYYIFGSDAPLSAGARKKQMTKLAVDSPTLDKPQINACDELKAIYKSYYNSILRAGEEFYRTKMQRPVIRPRQIDQNLSSFCIRISDSYSNKWSKILEDIGNISRNLDKWRSDFEEDLNKLIIEFGNELIKDLKTQIESKIESDSNIVPKAAEELVSKHAKKGEKEFTIEVSKLLTHLGYQFQIAGKNRGDNSEISHIKVNSNSRKNFDQKMNSKHEENPKSNCDRNSALFDINSLIDNFRDRLNECLLIKMNIDIKLLLSENDRNKSKNIRKLELRKNLHDEVFN